MASTPPCPVSDCHLEVDLIFESSDGEQFGVHGANLENFSAGFPPANFVQGHDLEVVKLKDFGSTSLPLFLQFIHHTDQPSLDDGVDIFSLLELGNGVEKYCVYSARQVCRLVLKSRMEENPAMALMYFAKHGYVNEADYVANWIMNTCHKWKRIKMGKKIGHPVHGDERVYTAWKRYEKSFQDHVDDKIEEPGPLQHKGVLSNCNKWFKLRKAITAFLKEDPIRNAKGLAAFIEKEEYQLEGCKWCLKRAGKWKKDIASFSSFHKSFEPFLEQ